MLADLGSTLLHAVVPIVPFALVLDKGLCRPGFLQVRWSIFLDLELR